MWKYAEKSPERKNNFPETIQLIYRNTETQTGLINIENCYIGKVKPKQKLFTGLI